MAHIGLPEGLPGIAGGIAFRPETAKPMGDLAEVLLRDSNTLSRGEREMIATYVSGRMTAISATTATVRSRPISSTQAMRS